MKCRDCTRPRETVGEGELCRLCWLRERLTAANEKQWAEQANMIRRMIKDEEMRR